jgi:non-ribosomal peptide synthetase-like protein
MTYAQIDDLADRIAAALGRFVAGECVVATHLSRRDPALYAAQLGIMKAGAAYTSLPSSTPDEVLRHILADSKAVAVVTSREYREHALALGVPAAQLIVHEDLPASAPRLTARPAWLTPQNLAYVIYTSGTTGKPKGVMIEHHSIVTLVLADAARYGVHPEDRCSQNSSPAYDSSLEEIYLAFATGARLVVADDDVVRMGPDLVGWLQDERITVLCPAPTLLKMCLCEKPREALPNLKLVYVGGEALTSDVLEAWAPGRWLENGYGPTECTVTCTRERAYEGRPITVGTATPGNLAVILDAELREVAPGETGELCIGGEGVARGYLGKPELTSERFIQHPEHGRLYRSGDLARVLPNGHIDFLGRADDQVKIRGHRVELGAIEAELTLCDGVRAAACRMQAGPGGSGDLHLVAFVVPSGESVDLDDVLTQLAIRVPAHMLPAKLGVLPELPMRASSQKLDRSRLPELDLSHAPRTGGIAPRDALERTIADAFAKHLPQALDASVDDDFFLDLGGNSLLAAQVLSTLRKQPGTAALTVRDIYDTRTIGALAARVRAHASHSPSARTPERVTDMASHPKLVALAQLASIAIRVTFTAAMFYVLAFRVIPPVAARMGASAFLLLLPSMLYVAGIAGGLASIALTILAKRLLIGRYESGRHAYLGSFHLRHWLVKQFAASIPWGSLEGTFLHVATLRALGAKIGRDVHLHHGVEIMKGGWDLLTIEDGATLGREVSLGLTGFEQRELVLGAIHIGKDCTLDTRSRLSRDTVMDDGAFLTALSHVPSGGHIPAGQRWDGIPAVHAGDAPPAPALDSQPWPAAQRGAVLMALRFVTSQVGILPTMAIAAAWLPLLNLQGLTPMTPAWFAALPISFLLSVSVIGWVLALPLEALMVRALGPIPAGTHPLNGWYAINAFLKDRLIDSANSSISGTLFWPMWLRLAGMRIGRKAEISTISEVIPELVSIGNSCFFADGIYLGRPLLHRGTLTCAQTSFSDNTFLGNHVVIPSGVALPSDILLGICTVADPARIRAGTSWFGHPSFELPRREIFTADRALTHDPPFIRRATRVFWECTRVALPILPLLLGRWWLQTMPLWREGRSTAEFYLVALPFAALLMGGALCLASWLAKWLVMGPIREGRYALWSCWAMRWDFLYETWSNWANLVVSYFEGTPFLAYWLRAMGAKVGHGVVFDGSFVQLVEPEMLEVGDEATVACHLQSHSFEDRVLKLAPVRIGARSTVGAGAVLLYGAVIGEGTTVGENSVVMKHEDLLPGLVYSGFPTRPVTAVAAP